MCRDAEPLLCMLVVVDAMSSTTRGGEVRCTAVVAWARASRDTVVLLALVVVVTLADFVAVCRRSSGLAKRPG